MSTIMPRATWNILLLSLAAFCPLAYADSKSITVSDPRPIAKAIEQLEGIYGLPITYEDPVYVHNSELTDVTEKVRRDQQNFPRVMIPRERTISFRYDIPSPDVTAVNALRQSEADRKAAVAEALSNILESYAASHGAGMFAAVEDNGVFHVVPTHFINAEGKVQQITPLLDTVLTIQPKQRTGADLLSEICASLSLATGQTVVVGTTPSSSFARHTTTITGSGVTARSLLSQLLSEMGVHLSWQLFYDPGLRWYVLNVHSVTGANK